METAIRIAQQTNDWRTVGAILSEHPALGAVIRELSVEASTASAQQIPFAAGYSSSDMSPVVQSIQQQQRTDWKSDIPQSVRNARILRAYADNNPWARTAINVRKQQIGQAPIAVLPANSKKPYDKQALAAVAHLLKNPNRLRQNFGELLSSVIEDILVLDQGCILKNMTVKRLPVELYALDGATIQTYTGWSGNHNEPRYLYKPPEILSKAVPLRNDELIAMMANKATYRLGLSPLAVLKETIERDMTATQSASDAISQKPPSSLIQIPGASGESLQRLRSTYETEMAGRRQIMWIGGDAQVGVHPLVFSLKDNQWMDWLNYIVRQIAVCFQISPQQLGLTGDINRATAQVQQDIAEDVGLIPLFLLLEQYLNREVLGDFAPKTRDGYDDLAALNLRISFPEVAEAARLKHAHLSIQLAQQGLAGLPSMTLNEIRAFRGEDPIPEGNTYWVMTTNGPMPWLNYTGKPLQPAQTQQPQPHKMLTRRHSFAEGAVPDVPESRVAIQTQAQARVMQVLTSGGDRHGLP